MSERKPMDELLISLVEVQSAQYLAQEAADEGNTDRQVHFLRRVRTRAERVAQIALAEAERLEAAS